MLFFEKINTSEEINTSLWIGGTFMPAGVEK
jgi:hypothetical protein